MRMRAFYALPLLWCVSQGASSSELPESSELLGDCEGHYSDIYAAAESWLAMEGCQPPRAGACFVPEHEATYSELKRRCERAHAKREEEWKAMNVKLPSYTSSVVIALSQLRATLRAQVHSLQETVRKQNSSLESARGYGVGLQRQLLLTSVESGQPERALLYHSTLHHSSPGQIVSDSYAYHGANGKVIARMLQFVRSVPAPEERAEAYRKLGELLKSNGQDERFPAVIFSQDVKQSAGVLQYAPDHAQYEGKTLARWQSLLLQGNFTEIALFASDYPAYYARAEAPLLAALKDALGKDALGKVIHFPSALPSAAQRLAALKGVLEALLLHQARQRNDAYLMTLAGELLALEAAQDATVAGEALGAVKRIFGQFSYRRDFSTYVALYDTFRSGFSGH